MDKNKVRQRQCIIYPGVNCNHCGKCVFSVNEECFHQEYQKNNPENDDYGIAFDLGTTNICCRMYNLNTKEPVGSCSLENPQRLYGKDVITRQTYVLNHNGGSKIIHKALIDGMNCCIENLCKSCGISIKNIKKIAAGGNTTISHFFLNLPVKGLTENPFKPAFNQTVIFPAGKFNLITEPDTKVILPGNLGGHVGSDITSGLLNDILLKDDGLTAYIDIGTNGEIVLIDKDGYLVTSVAAGPVFEEGYLSCGMKASEGAICEITIGRNLRFKTIGDKEPEGICGSGIFSLISEMLKAGLIDENGNLTERDLLTRRYTSKDIMDRMEEGKFTVYDNISLTQEDIRKFQLAKGAIRAGIKILLKEKGYTEKDICKAVITGAMGNHVSTEALVKTGIIPDLPEKNTAYIPNGSLEGLSKLLLDEDYLKTVEEIKEKTENLFLNERKDFEYEYIQEMMF